MKVSCSVVLSFSIPVSQLICQGAHFNLDFHGFRIAVSISFVLGSGLSVCYRHPPLLGLFVAIVSTLEVV